MTKLSFALCLTVGLATWASQSLAYDAPKASTPPVIDGDASDAAWSNAPWQAIDQLTLGEQPAAEDFSGRFKIVWTPSKLYLLGEIVDDILIDTHADPLEAYWEDDTFEIFLDEDHSGGDHLDNYNAFAYHIALDNQAIDRNTSGKPRYLNDHVTSVWKRQAGDDNKIIWEASFDIYPDTFSDTNNKATPVTLESGKKMGFMVAYCDSDSSQGREHFIGSYDIPALDGDKNRGYIDASVFETLVLVD
ncbi:sugar-binding protein [Arenicella xantha]|uniref:Carbohydrate binding protein with CBM9 domain n=1 Tax=Arenicella xantha TaxID=644221 RepID=A0A395JUF2_9GAMM|nr:sugar-binding protein [Arenicella xantha]RBP53178.1 carbohydrate binding protein with CBM9 domain [Arenicella xantha]